MNLSTKTADISTKMKNSDKVSIILAVLMFFCFLIMYPYVVNGTDKPAAINAISLAIGISMIGAKIMTACDGFGSTIPERAVNIRNVGRKTFCLTE